MFLTNTACLHSTGIYTGPPNILFNTSLSNPQEGMPFTLQCLTAPDPQATIVWLWGEQASGLSYELLDSESHEKVFEMFTSDDAGSYTCVVLDKGEIVAQATIDLQLSGLLNIMTSNIHYKYQS